MIAEENISNLSVVSPGEYGSVAHCAVKTLSLDNLRYVHSIVPDILLDVYDDFESVCVASLVSTYSTYCTYSCFY